jgi:hypothetical protein
METMFTKYTAINSVQKGITNVITAIPSAINNMAENNKAVKMGVDRNTLNAFNKAIRPV